MSFKIRKLSMSTKPKGKTIILDGERRETGEYFFILSNEAKVRILDLDNYVELNLILSRGKDESEEKKFLWSAGTPLIEGSFIVKKLSLQTVQIEFPKNSQER